MYKWTYLGIIGIFLFVIGVLVGTKLGTVAPTKSQKVVEVVTVHKPDGTVIVKETEKESSEVSPEPKKPDYSVSAKANILNPKQIEVELGRRMIWDLWGVAGWSSRDNTVSAGVRVEF